MVREWEDWMSAEAKAREENRDNIIEIPADESQSVRKAIARRMQRIAEHLISDGKSIAKRLRSDRTDCKAKVK
jgi:adenylate kinase